MSFLLAPAAANAACANPAGVAGDQIYSSNYNVMQYCNGASWVNMGSGSFLGEIIANNFCRANPTATQVDCNVAAINLATQVTGNLPVAHLNSGTDAGATTFWRGDGTWAIPQTATAGSAGSLTNPQNFSITGDATAPAVSFDGTAPVALSATVVKLQGRTLASTAPTDKQVLVWNNTSSQWEPGSVGPMLSGTAASPGLYFAESPTTGLYRPAADSFGIATGGAARLIVSATGSVGIGTVAPAVALDIGSKADAVRVPVGASGDRPSGLVGMIRYNTSTNQFEGFQGGTPAWTALGSTYWGALTANSFCRVDATGTVVNCTLAAIDLSSMVTGNLPVTNLAGGTGADATTFWRGDGSWATPTFSGSIYLGPSTAATNPSREGEANTGLFTPATGVVAVSSLGAEALRVTATGSVGIGTSSPAQKLDVAGSVNLTGNLGVGSGGVDSTTGVNVVGTSTDAAQLGIYNKLTVAGPLTDSRTNVAASNELINTTTNNGSYLGSLFGNINALTNQAGANYDLGYGSYSAVYNDDPSLTVRQSAGSFGTVANRSTGTMTDVRGVQGNINNASTGTIGTARGFYGYVRNAVGGAITTTYGVQSYTHNDGAGTITDAYGAHNQVRNDEGTTTTAYGNYSWIQQAVAGGTTGTSYGYYSRLDHDAGTMGTGYLYYGVYEGTHTTKWGLYLSGETSNYLSGTLGIKTAAVTAGSVLDLSGATGTAYSSMILPQDTTANRPTVGVAGMLRYNTTTSAFEGYSSAWGTLLSTTSSITSGVYLGASAAATNPQRSGDAGTGLFSDTATTVAIATGGVERLRVTATGSVGIGTTTPAQALHVYGTALVASTATTATTSRQSSLNLWSDRGFGMELHYGTGTQSAGWATAVYGRTTDAAALRLGAYPGSSTAQSAFAEYMTIMNTGKVGIGTTAPGSQLDVAIPTTLTTSVGSENLLRLTQSTSNVNNLYFMHRRHTAGSNWNGTNVRLQRVIDSTSMGFIDFGIDGLASNQGLGFGTNATTNMVITATGSVGIGTTTPAGKLSVEGAIGSQGTSGGQFVAHNPNNQSANVSLSWFNDGTDDWPRLRFGGSGAGANVGFQIQGPSDAAKLTVLTSGAVGIGTTTPSHKLQIADTDTTASRAGLYVSQTGAITGTGYGGYFTKTGASTTNVGLYTSASGATNNYGLIVAAGNVGIGTTTPTAGVALDLGSNAAATNSSVLLPKGTSANRPTVGVAGMLRYNTTTSAFEGYTSAWTGFVSSSSLSADVILGASTAATNPHRSGDATTGLFSPAASTIGFATAGSEAMRITATNSVGIGTTTPAQALDVSGNINVSAITNAYYLAGNKILHQPVSDTTSLGLGRNTLAAQTATGQYNMAIGHLALVAVATGYSNTAIGYEALTAMASGIRNTAVGDNTLTTLTEGNYNVAVGRSALGMLATGNNNTGLGSSAQYLRATGDNNTAVGYGSQLYMTGGAGNTALGFYALIGDSATANRAYGDYNTAVGYRALDAIQTTAENNTALGSEALGALTTGANNVAIGYRVASTLLTTGTGNILIGNSSAVTTPAAGTNNFLNIGNVINSDMANERVGLNMGTTLPSYPLQVGTTTTDGSGAYVTTSGVWTNASDRRIKENIRTSPYGTETLMKLKPVAYDMIGTHEKQIGFIAQEVAEVVPEVVSISREGRYGLSYGNLLTVAVKALQEMVAANDNRDKQIAALVEENRKLREAIAEQGKASGIQRSAFGGGQASSDEDLRATQKTLSMVIYIGGGLLLVTLGGLALCGVGLWRLRRRAR